MTRARSDKGGAREGTGGGGRPSEIARFYCAFNTLGPGPEGTGSTLVLAAGAANAASTSIASVRSTRTPQNTTETRKM